MAAFSAEFCKSLCQLIQRLIKPETAEIIAANNALPSIIKEIIQPTIGMLEALAACCGLVAFLETSEIFLIILTTLVPMSFKVLTYPPHALRNP